MNFKLKYAYSVKSNLSKFLCVYGVCTVYYTLHNKVRSNEEKCAKYQGFHFPVSIHQANISENEAHLSAHTEAEPKTHPMEHRCHVSTSDFKLTPSNVGNK